jgi:hypothetical protein
MNPIADPSARISLSAVALFRDSSIANLSGNPIAPGHDSQPKIGAKRPTLRGVGKQVSVEAIFDLAAIFRLKESE